MINEIHIIEAQIFQHYVHIKAAKSQ